MRNSRLILKWFYKFSNSSPPAILPCELSFGYIVDSTCLVWESKCGRRGNCWLYDQHQFRRIFLGISTAFMAVGSLFDFIIIFYADQMKSMYGEEEEGEVEGVEANGDRKLGE